MQTYAPQPTKARLALAGLALWAVALVAFGPPLIRHAASTNRTARTAEAGTFVFRTDEGGFTATFPSKPSRTVESEANPPVVIYQTAVGKGSLGIVTSAWPEETTGSPAEAVRAYTTTWAAGVGTLVSSAAATVQGNPAMDMTVDTPDGRVFARVVHVDGSEPRLVLLRTTSDPTPQIKAAYDRLVSSFRLNG